MISETVLEKAQKLVDGERSEAYGPPVKSWREIARLWSEILGFKVTASAALRCMIAMRLSRESHTHKRDNLTDIAGYTLIIEMVEAQSKIDRYEQVLRDTDPQQKIRDGLRPVQGHTVDDAHRDTDRSENDT